MFSLNVNAVSRSCSWVEYFSLFVFPIILTIPEIPSHNHSFSASNGDSSGTSSSYITTGAANEGPGSFGMTNTGGGLAHNNMQPYVVRLRIMKL